MAQNKRWYKDNPNNKIWWLDNSDEKHGVMIFSFDKKKEFNLFSDFPYKLTEKQTEIFIKEYPEWGAFFVDRLVG